MLFLEKSSVLFFVALCCCCQVLNGLRPIEKLVSRPSSHVMALRSAPDCGFKATVTSFPSKFTSPNYPNSYPSNLECNWQLTAGSDAGILLKIKQMSIEEFTDCGSDYLAIYDLSLKSKTLVRKLCGKVAEESILVISNQALLVFKSDSSFEQSGFEIEYSLASNSCDKKLTTSQGSIMSPEFPLIYPSDFDCYYLITVPTSEVIYFTFEKLKLEFHRDCGLDYVAIYDGPTAETTLLGRFCDKDLRSSVKSTTNSVLVHFHSNELNSGQEEGFVLSYDTDGFIGGNGSIGDCQWSQNQNGGEIRSPNYPSRYPSNSVCKMYITAPDHHVVKFTFTHLDLEPDVNCGYDSITIKEEGRTIGVLCGKPQLPLSVLTTMNKVHFSFNSDGFNEFTGFTLKYQYKRATSISLPAPLPSPPSEIPSPPSQVVSPPSAVASPGPTPSKPITPIAVPAPPTVHDVVSSIEKINTMCGRPTKSHPGKGKPKINDEKIVGGADAEKGAHPWQVMLWDPKYHAFCGGSLLNQRWFVSAAHCFAPKFTKSITWSQVRIRLGKLYQGEVESEEFSTTIDQIHIHYSFDDVILDNDIAVIRLKEFVRFTDYIMPICLGNPPFIEQKFFKRNNIRGMVTGWGRIQEGGAVPRILKELEIPLVRWETCVRSTARKVTRNMFCAGYSQESIGDTCQGDSGGPLIAKFDGRWYLSGLTSFGVGCNRRGQYGFYAKVNNYHDWILDTISINS